MAGPVENRWSVARSLRAHRLVRSREKKSTACSLTGRDRGVIHAKAAESALAMERISRRRGGPSTSLVGHVSQGSGVWKSVSDRHVALPRRGGTGAWPPRPHPDLNGLRLASTACLHSPARCGQLCTQTIRFCLFASHLDIFNGPSNNVQINRMCPSLCGRNIPNRPRLVCGVCAG
jgi:ribosomal protein S14